MPDYKPVVFHDFAAGYIAEALANQAVEALRDYGYSNAVQELFMELNRYRRNKSEIDDVPKHLMEIFTRYVEVWPTNYFDMEKAVGKEKAREWVPNKDDIPDLVWTAQDFLEADKDLKEIAEGFKHEIDAYITGACGSKQLYYDTAVKWLKRAGSNATSALSWKADRKSKKDTETAKVAA